MVCFSNWDDSTNIVLVGIKWVIDQKEAVISILTREVNEHEWIQYNFFFREICTLQSNRPIQFHYRRIIIYSRILTVVALEIQIARSNTLSYEVTNNVAWILLHRTKKKQQQNMWSGRDWNQCISGVVVASLNLFHNAVYYIYRRRCVPATCLKMKICMLPHFGAASEDHGEHFFYFQ